MESSEEERDYHTQVRGQTDLFFTHTRHKKGGGGFVDVTRHCLHTRKRHPGQWAPELKMRPSCLSQ